jgi:hypothetical protein
MNNIARTRDVRCKMTSNRNTVIPYVVIERIALFTQCPWTVAACAMTCKELSVLLGPPRSVTYPRLRAAAVHASIIRSLKNERRAPCETFEFTEYAADPLSPREMIDANKHERMFILVFLDRIVFMCKANDSEVGQNIGIFRFGSLDFSAHEMFKSIKGQKRKFASDQIASTRSTTCATESLSFLQFVSSQSAQETI